MCWYRNIGIIESGFTLAEANPTINDGADHVHWVCKHNYAWVTNLYDKIPFWGSSGTTGFVLVTLASPHYSAIYTAYESIPPTYASTKMNKSSFPFSTLGENSSLIVYKNMVGKVFNFFTFKPFSQSLISQGEEA